MFSSGVTFQLKKNPADASRSLNAARKNSSSRWFQGARFLLQQEKIWGKQTVNEDLSEDDPEIKKGYQSMYYHQE